MWSRLIAGLVAILALSIGAGYLLSVLGLGHPKGLIFKFLALVPLCIVGLIVLDYLKVRRGFVVLLGGLAGCVVMASICYFDYLRFQRHLAANLRLALQAEVLRHERAMRQIMLEVTEKAEAKGTPEQKKQADDELRKRRQQWKDEAAKLEDIASKMDEDGRVQELRPIVLQHGEELHPIFTLIQERLKTAGLQHLAESDADIDAGLQELSAGFTFRDYLDWRTERHGRLQVFGWERQLSPEQSRGFQIGEVLLAGLLAAGIMCLFSAPPKPKPGQMATPPNVPNGANP